MMWTLHLPIDLKSKNRSELNRGARAMAGIYASQRNRYALALWNAATVAGITPLARFIGTYTGKPNMETTPVPFRAVTVVRLMGERQRPFDDDGFIAGCAAFRDACQRERHHRGRYVRGAGLVWDDSAKWSSWHYEQRKSDDGKPGVEVRVEEVGQ
jgi:hypothetical protein